MSGESRRIAIDLDFGGRKPGFGDLFTITGRVHPRLPPSGHFDFAPLAALGFDQIDDSFGIPASDAEVDRDVEVWLHPTIRGRDVSHHHGPFDGVRLTCDGGTDARPARDLLRRGVAALLPFCGRLAVNGRTVAEAWPLDAALVLSALDEAGVL